MPPIPGKPLSKSLSDKIPVLPEGWDWTSVKLVLEPPDRFRHVVALAKDGMAVHGSVFAEGKWSATVVSVGIAAVHVGTKSDALKAAEVLIEHCGIALAQNTKEKVLSNLPAWVKPWCVACTKHGKFFDPLDEGGET